MTDFEKLLQRNGLPTQFEGRKDKRPMGTQRLDQLAVQEGAEWVSSAPDGLGGSSIEPYLKQLLNGNKMSVSDLQWLKRQLAAQIPVGGAVPCDPIFGFPYTFNSRGANMPSLNRKDNSKDHTTDNCEVTAARCNMREDNAYPFGLEVAFQEFLTEMRPLFDPSQAGANAAAKAARTAEAQRNLR